MDKWKFAASWSKEHQAYIIGSPNIVKVIQGRPACYFCQTPFVPDTKNSSSIVYDGIIQDTGAPVCATCMRQIDDAAGA